MSDDPITVVVVDDHPVFRDGLAGVVDGEEHLRVVATCGDGHEAVTLVEHLQPDVVLMDLNLPTLGGIEATRRIVDTSPHAAVLVITMAHEEDSVFAAVRAGARGYLLKESTPEQIVRAIGAVGQGEAVFGPGIADRVLRYFADVRSRPDTLILPQLTSREREVLQLVTDGVGNAEIARTLFISPKTVRNHISNIFTKLHVADRAEAIAVARSAGLDRDTEP